MVTAAALPHVPAEIARPHIRITPPEQGTALELRDLWDYRELIALLIWRDVKVRYKQTFLGVAWAVVQPVTSVILFSVVFGRLANLPSEGAPYPVFALAGLLPWQLFSSALVGASNSLVGSAGLLTKVGEAAAGPLRARVPRRPRLGAPRDGRPSGQPGLEAGDRVLPGPAVGVRAEGGRLRYSRPATR